MTYYPSERGPYNFDLPDGLSRRVPGAVLPQRTAGVEFDEVTNRIILKDPTSRWGGIMRYLPNKLLTMSI